MFQTLLPHDVHTVSETQALTALLSSSVISDELRARIKARAIALVVDIRQNSQPGIMELFLGEYGLSSEEGIALMCLAEALLRVPDGATIDALIEDKIAASAWGAHLGKSHSALINASTWALFITGKVLNEGSEPSIANILHGALKRLGEPVIRQAVSSVMKVMGRQFVLGETIESAMKRAQVNENDGFTYSYDMLGEAAKTDRDARRYLLSYSDAIGEIAKAAHQDDIRENPGISIKLSALHPRYESLQKSRVMRELVPRARSLAILAKSAGVGLNIDAEEAGRLDLSLDVIEAVLSDPALAGWDGFGVVVQAYGKRAREVIHWLYDLATRLDRRIMVRLVKGAYWDSEIKLSQVEGHAEFPVFTRKASTDVSYICLAQKLLSMTNRIYPQFATHNAHTIAAVLEMADDNQSFEFQRLHGMGEALHRCIVADGAVRSRIYAPVGAHKDLLAYLVRRLLENGANSSFVNQIVDKNIAPELVADDPFSQVETWLDSPHNKAIKKPDTLFLPERVNSKGWDLADPTTLSILEEEIAAFDEKNWIYAHCVNTPGANTPGKSIPVDVVNPATGKAVGCLYFATESGAMAACERVRSWDDVSVESRAEILNKTADLYEKNAPELFALLMREAGKTLADCVGEVREAVDFLRFYAAQAITANGGAAGIFTCISPWNFPLAIFTGQISAALAAGNGVLAKPAETTSLVATCAVALMRQAGVPDDVLILVPGTGARVGSVLVANPRVDGVCFTGSTATARLINQKMAENLEPHAPLIAETGGLNAMIIDSTALPEQAITDVVTSAFQSAGQRCSALRVLYLQEDIADNFVDMLFGAMDELSLGDPRYFATDIGPVIDASAKSRIDTHIAGAKADGRLLKQIAVPDSGHFVGPAVIRVSGIEDVKEEIFGPVLHIATFAASKIDAVIDAINGTGYGLTFALHSRIDDRVQHLIDRIEAGNIYINRNQIGAVVGSQPFGGDGLSGTGPKAGGAYYLKRFLKPRRETKPRREIKPGLDSKPGLTAAMIDTAFAAFGNDKSLLRSKALPGPTGESNLYSTRPRKNVLCLGPGMDLAMKQAAEARTLGCHALAIDPDVMDGLQGGLDPDQLVAIRHLDAVISFAEDNRNLRLVLSKRHGPIVPLVTETDFKDRLLKECHVCIDTTAAGGNASLMEIA